MACLFSLNRISGSFVPNPAYRALKEATLAVFAGTNETLPSPSSDASTRNYVVVATGQAWNSFPGNTLLCIGPSLLLLLEKVFCLEHGGIARFVKYTSQHKFLAWWMIPAGGLRTLSSSIGECTNSTVMSSNPMYLASFMFLPACQCQQCASNCKWRSASEGIVTCSVRNLLCH